MKVAVTAKGGHLTDAVDPRFGRAPYILIVDTETMEYETLDNSANVNAFKGAGIQAATMVADKGAQVLLTGYCGPNAFRTVQAAGMKVVSDVTGTVREAIEAFKGGQMANKMAYSESPNAEGHW
ncbi:MAG: dinitrogenase iron-molybdenum cofactor biosynthesis protein [uncultured bacterium]|nr:MAG: dinitrogenase iron-molybdenum cofactor biosynthesis protein [uncultured bacterium]